MENTDKKSYVNANGVTVRGIAAELHFQKEERQKKQFQTEVLSNDFQSADIPTNNYYVIHNINIIVVNKANS